MTRKQEPARQNAAGDWRSHWEEFLVKRYDHSGTIGGCQIGHIPFIAGLGQDRDTQSLNPQLLQPGSEGIDILTELAIAHRLVSIILARGLNPCSPRILDQKNGFFSMGLSTLAHHVTQVPDRYNII